MEGAHKQGESAGADLFDDVTPELRLLLNGTKVRPLVEYLARRLTFNRGERHLVFKLANGSLRETSAPHGPIRNEELEQLGLAGLRSA